MVTDVPFWSEPVGAPRSLAVEFPFGHILGQAHNSELQRRVALLLLGTMIGLLLTPLGMLYQDVGRALGFGTQALFFLTPIIYPVPKASWAGVLVNLNPVTPLLETTRDWLVSGRTGHLDAFICVSGVSLLLLFAGWVLYRIAMPHLISRMSA